MLDFLPHLLAAVLVILPLVPLWCYLRMAFREQRASLLGIMNADLVRTYFTFFPCADVTLHETNGQPKTDDKCCEQFKRFYNRQFGWRHFAIPLLFFFLVTTFLVLWVHITVLSWLRWVPWTAGTLPELAVAAIVGAYGGVLYGQIKLAGTRVLAPSDLLWATCRMVIAVPLGYAFAAVLDDNFGVPVAILIGVFPLHDVITIARRLAMKRFAFSDSPGGEESELQRCLQCVDQRTAERFSNDGITTVLQLAYSDPVTLIMRTNLGFSYVIDCSSQALLWLYLGEKLAHVRPLGLRGAQEVINYLLEVDRESDRSSPARQAAARKALQAAARACGDLDHDIFILMLREVAEDPFADFLHELWSANFPDEPSDEDACDETEDEADDDEDEPSPARA